MCAIKFIQTFRRLYLIKETWNNDMEKTTEKSIIGPHAASLWRYTIYLITAGADCRKLTVICTLTSDYFSSV